MGEPAFENFPLWIVAVSNLLPISLYFIGAFIIYQIGLVWVAVYILYVFVLEIRLLKGHCIDCYYFGKTCAFGKGKLSCLFFKKGNNERFAKRKITWKDILPDFLVFIIPMLVAIALLIIEFNLLILLLLILLFFLGFSGNALVRSKLACKHCKQREIGCPATQLFNKAKK